MIANHVSITCYSSGSTVLQNAGLERAEDVRYSSIYPGGLFADCTFFVARDITRKWAVTEGMRIKVKTASLKTVWEGQITTIKAVSGASRMGFEVTATGYWGASLMRQYRRKAWADSRYDQNTWQVVPTAYNYDDISRSDLMTLDRTNRLRWTPKSEKYLSGYFARVVYDAGTADTIKRVTFNYDLSTDAAYVPLYLYQGTGAPYTALPNAIDSNPNNYATLTALGTSAYLYIGAERTDWLSQAVVTLGVTVNTNSATLIASYLGTSGAWKALTITDNTISGGKCLAQSGTITWTKPADWAGTDLGGTGDSAYYVRFRPSAALTNVTISKVLVGEAQSWRLGLLPHVAGTSTWYVDATGTAAVDHTLPTPSGSAMFYFRALAAQTPPANGTVYGEISNLTVYTETGTITAREIALDVMSYSADLSSDTNSIGSLTYDLVPFVVEPAQSLADILTEVAGYGDALSQSWAAYLTASNEWGDDKPILNLQRQPALTATDLLLRLDEPGVVNNLQFSRSLDDVYNYYIIDYTDGWGIRRFITPDDDPTLKDDASIALYGRRTSRVTFRTTSPALLKFYAKNRLAQTKNVQWKVSGAIAVRLPVRASTGAGLGAQVAPCEIQAGMRLKIENFLEDLNGTGLTFILSKVDYQDDTNTATLSVGKPDRMDTWLARTLKAIKG